MKQAERKAATIAAILEAAESLAREEGLAALSVDKVIRAAGVSKGAFFHHFETRRALEIALLDRLATHFEADLSARVAAGRSFASALIEATCAEAERDALFLATLVAAVANDRALAAMIEARASAWSQRMIAEGASAEAAATVRATLDGLLLQCALRGRAIDAEPIRRALLRLVAEDAAPRDPDRPI